MVAYAGSRKEIESDRSIRNDSRVQYTKKSDELIRETYEVSSRQPSYNQEYEFNSRQPSYNQDSEISHRQTSNNQ